MVPNFRAPERPKSDPDPTAVTCYGLLGRRRPSPPDQMLLRFEDGRCMRAVTTAYLALRSNGLAAEEMIGLALIWDNTAPHINQQVRA